MSIDISLHSNLHAEYRDNERETDLRLRLCLSPSATATAPTPTSPLINTGFNSENGYPRALNNESLRSMKESMHTVGICRTTQEKRPEGITSGIGGLFMRRGKRGYSEAIGGEVEGRERRVVRLQMCESSACEEMQGSTFVSSVTPNHKTPAVGWPPVQTCRKNIISAQHHENESETRSDNCEGESEGSSNFVKVSMDGMPIGRKVDLKAHNSYDTLAVSLQNMFQPPKKKSTNPNPNSNSNSNSNHWRVLDPCSGYLLTYLDKDGDWMLVGDAPWRNFVQSVKRLRVAKIDK